MALRRYDFNNKDYYFLGDPLSTILTPTKDFTVTNIYQNGYDKNLMNYYISKRQYENAADYASMFKFTDPRKQEQNELYIHNLRREGRIQNAIWSKARSKDELWALDFNSRIFNNGGLEEIEDYDNSYANKFKKYKDALGGDEAEDIEVTFKGEKRDFLGIDWMRKDNPNNIDAFFDKTGWDEDYLRANGVIVSHNDGKTSLRFNKGNGISNELLYQIGKFAGRTPLGKAGDIVATGIGALTLGLVMPVNNDVEVQAYDKNNKALISNQSTPHTTSNYGIILQNLADTVDEAKAKADAVSDRAQGKEFTYSTNTYGFETAAIKNIRDRRARGVIKAEEANKEIEEEKRWTINKLMGSGLSQYEVYANFDGKNRLENEEMIYQDTEARQILKGAISNAQKDNNLYLQLCESGGKYGTLVTIPKHVKGSGKNVVEYPEIQIFIEGFASQDAQIAASHDTSFLASQELNDIKTYSYNYKFKNGSYITSGRHESGKSYFMLKNSANDRRAKEISSEQALQLMEEDKAVNMSVSRLRNMFINNDGKIINEDAFDLVAKQLAATITNNIHNDSAELSFEDYFGNGIDVDRHGNPTLNGEKLPIVFYDKILKAQELYLSIIGEFNN